MGKKSLHGSLTGETSVGILADIDRYDQGRAVRRVFRYLDAFENVDVVIGTTQQPAEGFDPLLSSRSVVIPRGRTYEFIKPLSHLIFFDLKQISLLEKAFARKRTTLIPLIRRVKNQNVREITKFSSVFCPTQESAKFVSNLVCGQNRILGASFWDAGAPIAVCGEQQASSYRVLVSAGRPTDEDSSIIALEVADRLLRASSEIEVTLSSRKASWPRWLDWKLCELSYKYGSRFSIFFEKNYDDYLTLLASHGFLVCCELVSDLGSTLSEATYMGKPWICTSYVPTPFPYCSRGHNAFSGDRYVVLPEATTGRHLVDSVVRAAVKMYDHTVENNFSQPKVSINALKEVRKSFEMNLHNSIFM